jgi:hypothetical protein
MIRVAHQLLGDGAGAADHLSLPDRLVDRPDDGDRVEPRMLPEPGVLGGHSGPDQPGGDLREADQLAAPALGVGDLPDQLPVAVREHQRGGEVQGSLLERFRRRQLHGHIDVAGQGGHAPRGAQQDQDQQPSEDAPAPGAAGGRRGGAGRTRRPSRRPSRRRPRWDPLRAIPARHPPAGRLAHIPGRMRPMLAHGRLPQRWMLRKRRGLLLLNPSAGVSLSPRRHRTSPTSGDRSACSGDWDDRR